MLLLCMYVCIIEAPFHYKQLIYITLVETRIISNPIDIVVERGHTAQFTVKATGYGNFTYQWYHNGTVLSSNTESSLYIYNSMEQNSGLYYCRVCNQDNNCASSTQAELTLSCTYVNLYVYIVY